MPTHTFMDLALDEAHAAADAGEVPIGCVIVCDGDLIAQAGNRTLADRDPTSHAEMAAIHCSASRLSPERMVRGCAGAVASVGASVLLLGCAIKSPSHTI